MLREFHAWVMAELLPEGELPPYAGGLPMFGYNGEKGFRLIIKKPVDYHKAHPWEEFAFPGGLYAVFSAWLPEMIEKYGQVEKWLDRHPIYMPDEKAELEGRYSMSIIVTPPELQSVLQNEQHDVFVPIKLREHEA